MRMIIAVSCLVLLASSVAEGTECDMFDYALIDWSFGAVVWQTAIPEGAESFIQRLEEAIHYVLDFWGYEAPVLLEGTPDHHVEFPVYNPAEGAVKTVPPLEWDGRRIRPIVVFGFPDASQFRAATGYTGSLGACWVGTPLASAFPESACWIWMPGAGYRNILVSQFARMETLVHEFAHWFTHQWLAEQAIPREGIPDYIIEGIAEVTCVEYQNQPDLADTLGVAAWAERYCLPSNIEGIICYSVGKNLVEYLIEQLGHQAFLETLDTWSNATADAIDTYQAGWRESLGLAGDCTGD